MRYTSLHSLKLYGQVPDPTLANPDDGTLTSAIERAESEFESLTGSSFQQTTYTDVQAHNALVDGYGWLWLSSSQAAPVTAVTSIKVRNLRDKPLTVDTLSWDANALLLPYVPTAVERVDPRWWTVRVLPTVAIPPIDPASLIVQWSYTAGFATIPLALESLINRLAWWVYKLREAPLGKVMMPELGLMEVPISMPPDIRSDMLLWRRVV